MAKGTVQACGGFALAIDIISCLLCLFITGFFGYTAANDVVVDTNSGQIFFVGYWNAPWYVDLGIAVGVIDFLLTLTTSILGCVTLAGQAMNRGLHMAKVGIEVLAWILMLVAAACATAIPAQKGYSLSDYTGTCGAGWNFSCSFGVAVALSWTAFCLLFIGSILHGVSLKHAKSPKQTAVPAPAAGDVEAAT